MSTDASHPTTEDVHPAGSFEGLGQKHWKSDRVKDLERVLVEELRDRLRRDRTRRGKCSGREIERLGGMNFAVYRLVFTHGADEIGHQRGYRPR